MSVSIRIRPVGAGLLHADGRKEMGTDMTKPVVAFRNFANAPIKTELNANKLSKRALNRKLQSAN